MERVNGATLREVIEAARPEDRASLAALLIPALCDAATELHEGLGSTVVHRDLTPGNVICPEADPSMPVLIDLGIAREWRAGAESDTTHFGTRAYAPPEQFGFGQTDVRSDVYALGMLIFFCLTGRDPEPADRERGFRADGVPASWVPVIQKAVALDPAERFANARELKAAIEGILGESTPDGGESVAVALPTPLAPARGPIAPAEKPARLFTPRNIVILVLLAIFLAASFTQGVEPEYYAKAPAAFNIVFFFLWMPYICLVIAYALSNKRWLRANVAFFRGRPSREVWKALLAMFGVLTLAMFIGYFLS